MSPVQIKTIDTSSIKLDVTYAYNVEKAIWRDFNLNDGKSPTDRQNRVTMANYALQVNTPAIEEDEYDITVIGTGIGMHDPIFTREVLGAKSNQLLRTLQPKLVTRGPSSQPSFSPRRQPHLVQQPRRCRPNLSQC